MVMDIYERAKMIGKAENMFEDYFADTIGMQSKDYNRIKSFCKQMGNGDIVYFEICQWKEERAKNTFDYDYIVIRDDEIIYDESNGEMKIGAVFKKLFDVMEFQDHYYQDSDFCYEDYLGTGCLDCGHCYEDEY